MDKQLLSYEQTYTSWTDDIPTCRWKQSHTDISTFYWFTSMSCCHGETLSTLTLQTFINTQCHVVISTIRQSSIITLAYFQGVRRWLEWKRGLQNRWKSNPQRTPPVRGSQFPFQEGGVRSLSLRRLWRFLRGSSGRLCDEETARRTSTWPACAWPSPWDGSRATEAGFHLRWPGVLRDHRGPFGSPDGDARGGGPTR